MEQRFFGHRNPFPAVDLIIELPGDRLVLIRRKNEPHGMALPGGFVEWGETLETAAVREAKEETGLDVVLVRQMHSYSDPTRDPRFHTISIVFIARAEGEPVGGDDAAEAFAVAKNSLPKGLCFDHDTVLSDYLNGIY